ncbi:MAG: IncP plasmid survival protein KfrC family protein [Burkholderiaceae bacterium]
MIQSKEPLSAGLNIQPAKQLDSNVIDQSDTLLVRAQETQAEQADLFDYSPLETQYSAAFAAQLEAKHDQAARIEDRLEKLIEMQASRLQQTQFSQPGIFSRPGGRAKWQNQMQQQQSTMQRLHDRFEAVREIKEGMSVHGPRIEELASRKLRTQDPVLAKEWDDMREAQRLHQVILRRQEQEDKQALEQERCQHVGRGLRLGLSQSK